MIDVTQADSYFRANNHTQAAQWGAYGHDARTGAIEEAKRILARALRRPMNEGLAPFRMGDTRRDDYAVFEQALFLLRSSPTGIMGGASPYPPSVPVPESEDQEPERTYAGGVCKAALIWLGIPAVISVRG